SLKVVCSSLAMSGRATLTIVRSTSSMNDPAHTATSAPHLRMSRSPSSAMTRHTLRHHRPYLIASRQNRPVLDSCYRTTVESSTVDELDQQLAQCLAAAGRASFSAVAEGIGG